MASLAIASQMRASIAAIDLRAHARSSGEWRIGGSLFFCPRGGCPYVSLK